MPRFTVHRNTGYTVVSNDIFRNKNLSYKATGLLVLMLSLPPEWDYTLEGLALLKKDGRSSVQSALRELEQEGYLVRRRVRDESGTFADMEYCVYEVRQGACQDVPDSGTSAAGNHNNQKPTQKHPQAGFPHAENPPADNPPAEKPHADNPPAEKPHAENPPAENPPAEKPHADNPPAEKPHADNPPAENPPENKKNNNKKNNNKTPNPSNTQSINQSPSIRDSRNSPDGRYGARKEEGENEGNEGMSDGTGQAAHAVGGSEALNPRLSGEEAAAGTPTEREIRRQIRANVDFAKLYRELYHEDILIEIEKIMVSTAASGTPVKIGREPVAPEDVRERYLALNTDDIRNILDTFKKNSVRVRNPTAYVRTLLYNAKSQKGARAIKEALDSAQESNRRQVAAKTNRFHNFRQRDIDYDEMLRREGNPRDYTPPYFASYPGDGPAERKDMGKGGGWRTGPGPPYPDGDLKTKRKEDGVPPTP